MSRNSVSSSSDAGILLGVVLGAHGLKGEVKVKTFTHVPAALADYGKLSTEDGRHFEVGALRETGPDSAVVRFDGVSDRNSAESLKGVKLHVARGALPEPDDDEFYHADLIGLRAEDMSGASLGLVKGLHNFGAGDVIEITDESGGVRYIPFTEDAVPTVDIAGGRIVVNPPREEDAS